MKEKKWLLINLIIIVRIFLSMLMSPILYPNTHNIIEAMLIDLSPYLIFGIGFVIYKSIIQKYEKIIFKYTSGSVLPIILIPIILISVIVVLNDKKSFIESYDENLALCATIFTFVNKRINGCIQLA